VSRGYRLPEIVMGLQGLAIVGSWAGFIRGGAFKDGPKTVENNMYLGMHLLAEMTMGVLLITGSVGLLMDRTWGRAAGLLGLGSVTYSTINSMADTIRNKPKLTPLLLVNLVVAVVAAFPLAEVRGPAKRT
jgi:hypothetical protein